MRQLVRELGVRQLAAAVFNYTVGTGIFVLPAYAAAALGGEPIARSACFMASSTAGCCPMPR